MALTQAFVDAIGIIIAGKVAAGVAIYSYNHNSRQAQDLQEKIAEPHAFLTKVLCRPTKLTAE